MIIWQDAQVREQLNDRHRPLSEIVPVLKRSDLPWNKVIGFLKVSDVDSFYTKHISDCLARRGFRTFKYMAAGDESLVLETTDNQLLKIYFKVNEGLRNDHPAILHPIARFPVSLKTLTRLPVHKCPDQVLTVSVMPHVRTVGVTEQHVSEVKAALEQSGYNVPDIGIENIGLIDIPERGIENLPVLIDDGLLEKKCRKHVKKGDADLSARWLSPDGTPWQNIFDPRIGTGKPTGVITDKELDTLRQLRPNSSITSVIESGGYREHIWTALEDRGSRSK